ncbi:MAG: fluoride efflux transporter CrcB [Terriglobales bacterium]
MALILWVAAGGAIGSAARYLVNVASQRLLGPDIPWGTLAVNVSGSFIMGILAALIAQKWLPNEHLRAFLTIGILGGFTTFSAYTLDFALLVERRDYLAAALYGAGSVMLSLAAVFLGIWLARAASA